MTNAMLTYNPYLLKAELTIEGAPINPNSPLAFIFGKPLHKWLQSSGSWRGLFNELSETVGDTVHMKFIGTPEDFADLKKNCSADVTLEYVLNSEAQEQASVRAKWRELRLLKMPAPLKIRPTTDQCTVHVVADDCPPLDSRLKVVMHEPSNLTDTLLRIAADFSPSVTIFASPSLMTAARDELTRVLGQDDFARCVYDSWLSDSTQVVNYVERFALTHAVRKFYFGLRKQLAAAQRDVDDEISDTSRSLESLRRSLADARRVEVAPDVEVEVERFDCRRFDELTGELLNELVGVELPVAERVVEKNFVEQTDSYLKLSDAEIYSQTVSNFLTETVDKLLKRADSSPHDLDLPTLDLEPLTWESFEPIGKRYDFVKYVRVADISDGYREQAARLLKERLRQIKFAAMKSADDRQAQTVEFSPPPTAAARQLQRAIESKSKRLDELDGERAALKNFAARLNRLLEIKP